MTGTKTKKYWLRASDKQELSQYLPRLERLYMSATQRGVPWARCYGYEIKMIKSGLATGRL